MDYAPAPPALLHREQADQNRHRDGFVIFIPLRPAGLCRVAHYSGASALSMQALDDRSDLRFVALNGWAVARAAGEQGPGGPARAANPASKSERPEWAPEINKPLVRGEGNCRTGFAIC